VPRSPNSQCGELLSLAGILRRAGAIGNQVATKLALGPPVEVARIQVIGAQAAEGVVCGLADWAPRPEIVTSWWRRRWANLPEPSASSGRP
jgi:hypothetical protein